MERYGLIGKPLGHSFSQKYFTEKFSKEGIDARYDLFEIDRASDIYEVINRHNGMRGLNVTIPYKEDVLELLDGMDDEARAIGAVNVIAVKCDKAGSVSLLGHNSDVTGFVKSIEPLIKPTDKKALVLGTGGASKAVIYGLRNRLGIEPALVSRNPTDGQIGYTDINEDVMNEYTVIVNATPVGMYPKVENCPNIPYELITSKHVCFDLVYNPLETLFLKKAAAQGAAVKNGLEMLHIQADEAWAFWQKHK